MELRHYQTECRDALIADMANGEKALGVLPTGTGKSLVIASLIEKTLEANPKAHILIVTHSAELVQQNCLELFTLCPKFLTETAIYSAGLGMKDIRKITFCGIQSVFKRAHNLFRKCDLVIIDEAHSLPHLGRDAKMWKTFFADLTAKFPGHSVCGLTATDYRLDGGYLTEGPDAFFTKKSYEYGIMDAIEAGYLCNLRSVQTEFSIDLKGISKTGGEYNSAQVESRIEGVPTETAVMEMVRKAQANDRKKWLIFGCGIKNCGEIAFILNRMDISAKVITGETPQEERAQTIQEFKTGDLTALVNHGVLTTGFNAPVTDLVAMFRPTASTGLWVQCIGRGTRLHHAKSDCLIIDYGGNTERHGYLDMLTINRKDTDGGSGKKRPSLQACPRCDSLISVSADMCRFCEFKFETEVKTFTLTVDKPLFSKDGKDPTGTFPAVLTDYQYSRHAKEGKPDSLKITFDYFSEEKSGGKLDHYFCFDHGGWAADSAARLFEDIFGYSHKTVHSALELLDYAPEMVNCNARLVTRGIFTNIKFVETPEATDAIAGCG